MAKLGKWSTGLGSGPKMAGNPYGQSNKGYDARQNLMSATEKHFKQSYGMRHTAQGNKVMTTDRNIKRKT